MAAWGVLHTVHAEFILIQDPTGVHTGAVGHPDAANMETGGLV